jgi:hypothetical protein
MVYLISGFNAHCDLSETPYFYHLTDLQSLHYLSYSRDLEPGIPLPGIELKSDLSVKNCESKIKCLTDDYV